MLSTNPQTIDARDWANALCGMLHQGVGLSDTEQAICGEELGNLFEALQTDRLPVSVLPVRVAREVTAGVASRMLITSAAPTGPQDGETVEADLWAAAMVDMLMSVYSDAIKLEVWATVNSAIMSLLRFLRIGERPLRSWPAELGYLQATSGATSA